MTDILLFIGSAFAYIAPAYISNASAALFGGRKPIDFGKRWKGNRIFGDGKTWRGLLAGIFFGTITGYMGGYLFGNIEWATTIGFLLATGALLGDLVASFFKRRAGLPRGHKVLIVDQLDFVIGALLLASLVHIPSIKTILFLLIVTPAIHISFNFIAHKIKCKKEPW